LTDLRTGETWAPERFSEEIDRRVAFLLERGLGPSPRVLIAHGGTPAFLADLYAVWHLGACAACVDSSLSAPELDNLVRFFEPELALVDASFSGPLAVPFACTSGELPPVKDLPPAAGHMEDPALVLFTSGTTGEPKGVVHTFRSLLARVSFNRYEIGKRSLERSLCLLPTHFGHGLIGNCLTPLFGGHHLFLWGGFRRDPARLGQIIDEHEVSFFSSVPTHWKLALESAAPPRGSSLRRVHIGSAPLSAELWRAAQAWSGVREVVNAYGITEAANWICGASGAEFEPEDGLIGRPWGKGDMCVRDDDGGLNPSGEGELLVRSQALMRGYLARDDLTARVMHDDWFRTGDFGSLDEGGVARLCGRQASVINRSGMKLYPEDIDLVLERHPGVREACAFSLPDEIHGEIVAAAVCVAQGATPSTEALEQWCRERLRRQAVPGAWFFLDEIPKTERGKVSRARVRDACLRGRP
jgi:acyl-coenzyme A synthetase/AMP-(fatty) acid ligase